MSCSKTLEQKLEVASMLNFLQYNKSLRVEEMKELETDEEVEVIEDEKMKSFKMHGLLYQK